jgi:hypothetical protein
VLLLKASNKIKMGSYNVGVAGKAFAYHTPPPNDDGPNGYLYSVSPEVILASKVYNSFILAKPNGHHNY